MGSFTIYHRDTALATCTRAIENIESLEILFLCRQHHWCLLHRKSLLSAQPLSDWEPAILLLLEHKAESQLKRKITRNSIYVSYIIYLSKSSIVSPITIAS